VTLCSWSGSHWLTGSRTMARTIAKAAKAREGREGREEASGRLRGPPASLRRGDRGPHSRGWRGWGGHPPVLPVTDRARQDARSAARPAARPEAQEPHGSGASRPGGHVVDAEVRRPRERPPPQGGHTGALIRGSRGPSTPGRPPASR
jgi:hypothetical protein